MQASPHPAPKHLAHPPAITAHLRRRLVRSKRQVRVGAAVVHARVCRVQGRSAGAVGQGIQVPPARVVRRSAVAVQHRAQAGVLCCRPRLQPRAVLPHRLLKPPRLEGGIAGGLGGLGGAAALLACSTLLGCCAGLAQALQLRLAVVGGGRVLGWVDKLHGLGVRLELVSFLPCCLSPSLSPFNQAHLQLCRALLCLLQPLLLRGLRAAWRCSRGGCCLRGEKGVERVAGACRHAALRLLLLLLDAADALRRLLRAGRRGCARACLLRRAVRQRAVGHMVGSHRR